MGVTNVPPSTHPTSAGPSELTALGDGTLSQGPAADHSFLRIALTSNPASFLTLLLQDNSPFFEDDSVSKKFPNGTKFVG